MSKKDAPASEKALGEFQKVSVYDFFYCDSRRIGSFLAQFDYSGHLERLIQRETATTGAKRGWKAQFGGGAQVVGTGGSGSLSLELSPTNGGSEANERVYDPLWANALAFLDYLTQADLIQRNIKNTRIGQIALLSGNLAAYDLSLLKVLWNQPFIKQLINGTSDQEDASNRRERRANKASGKRSNASQSEADASLAIMDYLPHSVVGTISLGQDTIWLGLKEQNLTSPSSEVLLKHGSRIPGVWNVLGIMDAHPEAVNSLEESQNIESGIGELGTLAMQLAGIARAALGRPASAYGMTPLLIFREVLSEDAN